MSQKKQTKRSSASKGELTIRSVEQERQRQHARNVRDALISTINWQWRKFALNIMNGMMKYEAYAKAYGYDDVETNESSYKVCATLAGRLLKKVEFRRFYRDLLEEQGFSDDIVDTQMMKQITDPNMPENVRRAAIHDYNELTGRIVKKSDITSGGKPIPVAMVEFIGEDSEEEDGDGSATQSQG